MKKHTVNANPDVPTINLGLSQRAIGKLLNIDLDEAPTGQAQGDLAGDLFWSLYSQDVTAVNREELPGSRQINAALIDWLKSTAGWPKMQQTTETNLPVSLVTSALSWASLTTEEALQEALKKQKEAEEAEAEAAQAQAQANGLQAAANAAQEEGEEEEAAAMGKAAAQAQAKADKAAAKAQAAAAAAMGELEEAQGDPNTQAAVSSQVKQAAEEAEDMANAMASYGLDAGSPGYTDPEAARRFIELYGDKLEEIAKLAGRFRGIASQSSKEKIEVGHILGDVKITQNLLDVLPTEKAYLRADAAPWLRAQKVGQFIDGGLPGYKRYGEAKEEGPVVIMVDGSGSMDGSPEIVAKAVAIGVAEAVRAGGRPFILGTFSSAGDPVYTYQSDWPWDEMMQWAEAFQGGGTDFNTAFAVMIENLDRLAEKAQGADVIFITDGAGHLSSQWRDRWEAYREEKGSRFLLVPVGSFNPNFLGDIPDQVLALEDLSEESGAALAESLGQWIR